MNKKKDNDAQTSITKWFKKFHFKIWFELFQLQIIGWNNNFIGSGPETADWLFLIFLF